ncbi:c-type cytochrome [Roseateles sp.]|uniref:c-type cytochrome n=1 Tax=Roseateles sp. TaxID=1971397 RepID=UPI0037C6690A
MQRKLVLMTMRRTLVLVNLALSALGAANAQPTGPSLYSQHCAACHQADATGTVGLAPTIKGDHWRKLGSERAYLATVLVHGMSGPIKIAGQTFVGSMPGFGASLDDASLALIATHVRTLQGAVEPAPYTADEIRAVRAAGGSAPQTRQMRRQILGE